MQTIHILFDEGSSSPVQSQCDCACAEVATRKSSAVTVFDNATAYVVSRDSLAQSLSPDWTAILSPGNFVVLNQPAAQLLTSFEGGQTPYDVLGHLPSDWPAEQTRTTIQEMVSLGLLVPLDSRPQVPPETPTTLNVWLHVTSACNLRCAYCYVPKSEETMSQEVGRQAIDTALRSAIRHGFRQVKIKYAGGEPTLYFDLVTQFQAYARAQADALGLELITVILSNGVALSNHMLETMLAQEIRLSISLDGLDGEHNAQRPRADGSGSASAVRDTIERVLMLGLCPDVTVTVTDRNIDTLPNVVAWLVEHNLHFNLNFYRENDNSAYHTDLRLQEERLIAALRKAFAAIEEHLPQRSPFGSLLDRVQFVTAHHYPCAAGRSYLVIDPSGRICQCQMTMHQPITDVWANDPLALVQSTRNGIHSPPVEKKEGCQDCQWRYWCAGGCPLQTYRAMGRYDARSPFCAVYRALFPDVVRLEGLRLLTNAHADVTFPSAT